MSQSVKILFPHNHEQCINDIINDINLSGSNQKFLSEDIISFISAFSSSVFKNKSYRAFPELVALASWFRSKKIEKLVQQYSSKKINTYFAAKGLAFHIAPSNVDTIFVYSLFISLLAGNKNIIKVSSRNSEIINEIVKIISEIIDQDARFNFIKNYIVIIKYDNQKQITDAISSQADLRVIWGGDQSILNIRKSELRPTASEVAFPNRFSFSIFDANSYLSLIDEEKCKLINKFIIDITTFGQQACSSPRMMFWIGDDDKTKTAFNDFVQKVKNINFADEFDMTERLVSVTNFVANYSATVAGLNYGICNLNTLPSDGMLQELRECHTGNNWLLHLHVHNIGEIQKYLTYKDQTISYFGLSSENISHFLESIEGRAIDRIVPIGNSLDFDHVWDGNDLLMSFSRQVRIY